MITVNTSYTNLVSQHTLAKNTNALQKTTERLSTGARINHARDDAAGVFLDVSLSSQISAMKTANDNTLLATNFLNIANGTLTTVSDCLMRMNDLATQACNGVLSDDARNTLQNEMNSLVQQANQSLNSSSMNGVSTMTVDTTGVPAVAESSHIGAGASQAAGNGNFIGSINQRSQAELEAAGYVACTEENFSDLETTGYRKFYISSVEDLLTFRDYYDYGGDVVEFTLTSDLDLSGLSWYFGKMLKQVVFDGNGHVIRNLSSNDPYVTGLFDILRDNSEIKNLGLENVNITSTGSFCGGLVGEMEESSISNCYVTGTVSGECNSGGLVGSLIGGSIEKSYAVCNVSGDYGIGGLVGYINYSQVQNCYAAGNVQCSEMDAGGLVGSIDSDCSIMNSYATGNVSSEMDNAGGLVGYSMNDVSIANCYATGDVTCRNTTAGGLVGYLQPRFVIPTEDPVSTSDDRISNCYATGLVNGVLAEEAANKASFDSSMLNSSIWDKSGTNPVLKGGNSQNSSSGSGSSSSSGGGGEVSVSQPVIRLQIGDTADANSAIEYNSTISLNFEDLDLSDVDSARASLAKIQANLQQVTAKQSYIGTQINRLSDIYNSQQVRIENTSAAKSTISDADLAKEVANMVKSQILQQISVSVLTQSQSISGKIALSLL